MLETTVGKIWRDYVEIWGGNNFMGKLWEHCLKLCENGGKNCVVKLCGNQLGKNCMVKLCGNQLGKLWKNKGRIVGQLLKALGKMVEKTVWETVEKYGKTMLGKLWKTAGELWKKNYGKPVGKLWTHYGKMWRNYGKTVATILSKITQVNRYIRTSVYSIYINMYDGPLCTIWPLTISFHFELKAVSKKPILPYFSNISKIRNSKNQNIQNIFV